MATRGERRKKQRALRKSRGSLGSTSCARSMPPRLLLEAYSVRRPNDPTVASYCADPFSESDPQIGFGT